MGIDQATQSLFILAFDHRGSFVKDLFGIEGEPTAAELAAIADLKHAIFEGLGQAVSAGCPLTAAGALVDEQYGGTVPREARAGGFVLAMPVERSGQAEFEFEYGADYRAHVAGFDPDYVKVLVRYNPDGDTELNRRQTARLRELSDWLIETDRKFLFELLVPATPAQLASVEGDVARYDRDLRADLMVRTIRELQQGGVEPKVWKIEGLESVSDCAAVAAQCTADGRDEVRCVVLGRGANDAKVDQWLRTAAVVPGYIGFAVGRSIWLDALMQLKAGKLDRPAAVDRIAANYAHFVGVFNDARLNP